MHQKLLLLNPLNHSLLSNGFTEGTSKQETCFDPTAADVVRAANYSEGSIVIISKWSRAKYKAFVV
jgi:hypothetical protein